MLKERNVVGTTTRYVHEMHTDRDREEHEIVVPYCTPNNTGWEARNSRVSKTSTTSIPLRSKIKKFTVKIPKQTAPFANPPPKKGGRQTRERENQRGASALYRWYGGTKYTLYHVVLIR
jgi:hypothetical protein